MPILFFSFVPFFLTQIRNKIQVLFVCECEQSTIYFYLFWINRQNYIITQLNETWTWKNKQASNGRRWTEAKEMEIKECVSSDLFNHVSLQYDSDLIKYDESWKMNEHFVCRSLAAVRIQFDFCWLAKVFHRHFYFYMWKHVLQCYEYACMLVSFRKIVSPINVQINISQIDNIFEQSPLL